MKTKNIFEYIYITFNGVMAERSIAPVLKTGGLARDPGVRISLTPPIF